MPPYTRGFRLRYEEPTSSSEPTCSETRRWRFGNVRGEIYRKEHRKPYCRKYYPRNLHLNTSQRWRFYRNPTELNALPDADVRQRDRKRCTMSTYRVLFEDAVLLSVQSRFPVSLRKRKENRKIVLCTARSTDHHHTNAYQSRKKTKQRRGGEGVKEVKGGRGTHIHTQNEDGEKRSPCSETRVKG